MRWVVTAALALAGAQFAFAERQYTIPLFVADGNPDLEGFARIVNHSDRSGTASILAIDDDGEASEPVVLSLGPKATRHFNSGDLESGNPSKGLSGTAGNGVGDWRLEITTDLDLEPLAYIRTQDGFLTSVHELVPAGAYVEIFNPASNTRQQSLLRLINPNESDVTVFVAGLDDAGDWALDDGFNLRAAAIELPPGGARTVTAQQLEGGGEGFEGELGDGSGKWRLRVIAEPPVLAMSLLKSPTGNLTNLSSMPSFRERVIPLFPPGANPDRQGFVRLINYSEWPATADVFAIDDTGRRLGPVPLSMDGWATVHFNSDDLETGNPSKGITQGVGDGNGNWRLEMTSRSAIRASAFARTREGFLTSMHDVGRGETERHYLPIFNPASNANQCSLLRLVNPGEDDLMVSIAGIDDAGKASAGTVSLGLASGSSVLLTSGELEAGGGDLQGMLGDGEGKWQLWVSANGPIFAMSLMESSDGKLTNLSRRNDGRLSRLSSSYKLTGEDDFNAAGGRVAPAGDIDADGLADLIVGAAGNDADPNHQDYSGYAYIVGGSTLSGADREDGVVDGQAGLGDVVRQQGAWKLVGEGGEDRAGLAVASAGDVSGDGLPDVLVGAPGHDAAGDAAGSAYLISASGMNSADAADGSTDGAVLLENVAMIRGSWKLVGEEPYDLAGSSLAAAGDLDADGIADFLVGAPADPGEDDADMEQNAAPGSVYLISGAALPDADRADGNADGVVHLGNVAIQPGSWKLDGEQALDHAGISVASVGDTDGDGLPDVIVGATGADSESDDNVGAAYLISASALRPADAADGSVDGVVQLDNVAAQAGSWKFIGGEDDHWVGQSVASAGDVDGDGLADLIIGRWALVDVGPVYLIAATGLAALDSADEDVDGIIDLNNVGRAAGSWQLIAKDFDDDPYNPNRRIYYTRAGFSVSPAGDVDGDGLADFLVGTRNGGVDDMVVHPTRAAFLLAGKDLTALDEEYRGVDGVINLDAEQFEAVSSWQFIGEGLDNAGVSVSAAGDVDGDGSTDLAIGADQAGSDDEGAVYLVSAADLVALDRATGLVDGVIRLGRIVSENRGEQDAQDPP